MWMMDHIMNNRLSLEFGQSYLRIPLKKSPHIKQGNALDLDWNTVIPAGKCSFILGNPPFVGHQWRTARQQKDTVTPSSQKNVKALAQKILDVRARYPQSTLDDLYDQDSMPADLRRAHYALDKCVDRLYRKAPFKFERERVEHLFALYEATAAPLEAVASRKASKRRKRHT